MTISSDPELTKRLRRDNPQLYAISSDKCAKCGEPFAWYNSSTPYDGKQWMNATCPKCGKPEGVNIAFKIVYVFGFRGWLNRRKATIGRWWRRRIVERCEDIREWLKNLPWHLHHRLVVWGLRKPKPAGYLQVHDDLGGECPICGAPGCYHCDHFACDNSHDVLLPYADEVAQAVGESCNIKYSHEYACGYYAVALWPYLSEFLAKKGLPQDLYDELKLPEGQHNYWRCESHIGPNKFWEKLNYILDTCDHDKLQEALGGRAMTEQELKEGGWQEPDDSDAEEKAR